MKMCLILEGSYPYVHGGVSTWMHQYITEMKEHEFVLWVVGATHKQKGKFVYELPEKMELTHVNLNDNSVEGMKSEELNIRCVQFHPEASPGPEETAYIFDDFLSLIK